MGNWLNGSPQQQQPSQLAALAQQLGIDPALMGAFGQQGPTRAQMLGQLGAAITANNQYGRNAITNGLADFTMMQAQGQQGGDPMGNLARVLELQGLLDSRKSADAKAKRLAALQERIDSGEKFTENEIAKLALEYPEAQNVWQQMLKGLAGPAGISPKDIDVDALRLRAKGIDVPGMENVSPEQAAEILAERQAEKIEAARAGATVLPGDKKFTDTLGKGSAETLMGWQEQAAALTDVAANAADYADVLTGLEPQLDSITGAAEVMNALPGVNRLVNKEELGKRQLARGAAGNISLAKAQLIKGALSDSDRNWLNSLGPQSTWTEQTRAQYKQFTAQLAEATNQAVAEVEAAVQAGAIPSTTVSAEIRKRIAQLNLAERNGFLTGERTNADNQVPALAPAEAAKLASLPEGQRFADDNDIVWVIRNGKPVRE